MTGPKQLIKACTAKVRRAAIEECGGNQRQIQDRGLLCENRANHLNPC
jgi:hypothetical protein